MILETFFLHSHPGNSSTVGSIPQLETKVFKNLVEQAFCVHAFKAESSVSQSQNVNTSQSFVVSIAEWKGQEREIEPNSKYDRDKWGPGEVGVWGPGGSKSMTWVDLVYS